MGPIATTSDRSRSRRLFSITDARKATLRGDTLELELTLSGVPDRAWLEVFRSANEELPIAVAELPPPRIVENTILWSIGKNALVPAWWYLNRCIDHANAASFPDACRGRLARERACSGTPMTDEVELKTPPPVFEASPEAIRTGARLDSDHRPETNGRMGICRRCGMRTDGPEGNHTPEERQLARANDWLEGQAISLRIARLRSERDT